MILVSAWLIFAFGKLIYDLDRDTMFTDILNPLTSFLVCGILDMVFQTQSSFLFGGVLITIALIRKAMEILGG